MSSTGALVVNAAEMLRVPGTNRHIDVVLAPSAVRLDDGRLAGDIEIELDLDSTLDGIVVTGRLVAPWHGSCRRCLRELDGVAGVDVQELYQVRVTDPDAFPIVDGQLDLTEMVREDVLLELPDAPLCRHDCAGLCPVCGIDRNEASCSCDTTVRDDRWAALGELRLDD
jgi:uncharacterized protein